MTDLVLRSTILRPEDRGEWLRIRHGYANASDAGVYVGVHPFKSLADLAVEKLAEAPEEKSSRAMERGNRLEAAVADWWAAEHGVMVEEPEVMFACGRILATLDRTIVGAPREALEVKTTAKRVDDVEPYWWWQAQAQMHAADLDRVRFAVLDGSMDLASYVVERDDEAIAMLVEQVEKVWSYLDLGLLPEGVELTADHVQRMHPTPVPGAVVDVAPDVVQAWMDAKALLSDAEKAEKAARDALCRMIGDAETVAIDGTPVLTWRAQVRSSLDTKALKAEYPELVSKFEKTSAFRVLRQTKAA